MSDIVEIYVDGGSRGNPGPAAIAFVIPARREQYKKAFPEKRTNNEAEYMALIYALSYAELQKFTQLRVFTDSQLVANQINGTFGCYDPRMKRLLKSARVLIAKFTQFEIILVKRRKNREADRLCNEALDELRQVTRMGSHSA